jgi:hypothetical protein
MDTTWWLAGGASAAMVCAIGLWVGRWSLAPRMAELKSRIAHLEKARQVALEHSQQAKRQIEILQKEISLHQKARTQALAERRRSRELQDVLSESERTQVLPPRAVPGDNFNLSRLPAHGFADTQPI